MWISDAFDCEFLIPAPPGFRPNIMVIDSGRIKGLVIKYRGWAGKI
jgi:hypothetical protein